MLSAYKLDKAFTDGVEITLEQAPDDCILVRLPSQYNRAYMQAMYEGSGIEVEEGGAIKVSPGSLLKTRYSQEDAFVSHCLISINGEPVPQGFAQDYPEALLAIMEKAGQLAADLDKRVDDSAKKLPGSSSGSDAGQEESNSTLPLSSVAS